MKLLMSAVIGLGIVCGCATHNGGRHTLTGKARPSITPEAVKLYAEPPPKYEVIGIVSASAYGDFQGRRDKAMMDLKKHAAQLGANGIILEPVTYRDAWSSESLAGAPVVFSGRAVFVDE